MECVLRINYSPKKLFNRKMPMHVEYQTSGRRTNQLRLCSHQPHRQPVWYNTNITCWTLVMTIIGLLSHGKCGQSWPKLALLALITGALQAVTNLLPVVKHIFSNRYFDWCFYRLPADCTRFEYLHPRENENERENERENEHEHSGPPFFICDCDMLRSMAFTVTKILHTSTFCQVFRTHCSMMVTSCQSPTFVQVSIWAPVANANVSQLFNWLNPVAKIVILPHTNAPIDWIGWDLKTIINLNQI